MFCSRKELFGVQKCKCCIEKVDMFKLVEGLKRKRISGLQEAKGHRPVKCFPVQKGINTSLK